jgi:ketosteroid isomerase-like protein
MYRSLFALLAPFLLAVRAPPSPSSAAAPQQTASGAVDALLAADRAFSGASARVELITGLVAMFADSVTMPVPSGVWASGVAGARDALHANPDNAGASVSWTPVRGGVSGDGQQGFTFGYMTMRRADSSTVPLKYLAYWVKEPRGWCVVAYKRARRPDGDVSVTLMPPSLPARTVAPTTAPASIAAIKASLAAAEQAFSDEAQKIGLGAAFMEHGRPDAMNMGSGPTFTIGADAIGRAIGAGSPDASSPVSWNADRTIIASSGDLGITLGMIRRNSDPSKPGSPFFTIWRRASPRDPWRYIAE